MHAGKRRSGRPHQQAGEMFVKQPAAEQRKLLHLVVKEAAWKGGALQVSLREPFAALDSADDEGTSVTARWRSRRISGRLVGMRIRGDERIVGTASDNDRAGGPVRACLQ